LLLGEGVVFPRKQTLVEYIRDDTDPALVEMMEDSGADSLPVVDWHERALGFRPLDALVTRHQTYHNGRPYERTTPFAIAPRAFCGSNRSPGNAGAIGSF
jgi:hypothetical protein